MPLSYLPFLCFVKTLRQKQLKREGVSLAHNSRIKSTMPGKHGSRNLRQLVTWQLQSGCREWLWIVHIFLPTGIIQDTTEWYCISVNHDNSSQICPESHFLVDSRSHEVENETSHHRKPMTCICWTTHDRLLSYSNKCLGDVANVVSCFLQGLNKFAMLLDNFKD